MNLEPMEKIVHAGAHTGVHAGRDSGLFRPIEGHVDQMTALLNDDDVAEDDGGYSGR